MGKVLVEVAVSNDRDEGKAQEGLLRGDQVRRAKLHALADTGATMLVLPEEVVKRLGLPPLRQVNTRLANGQFETRTLYGSVHLKVLNREITVDALGAPPGVPALLGQIPLGGLDFLVDSRNQRLMPNPESPDPQMALVDVF
jgi:predicted aspartyl protease